MKLIVNITLMIIFEKEKEITNKQKIFQLKSNLEKRVKIKFYKKSFLKTTNLPNTFFVNY